MKLHANAKINLCLDVVKKRSDGYHEMDMIMTPLHLHDTLWIEPSDEEQYACNNQDLVFDEHNTIVKAVKLMRETYHLKDFCKIRLEKRIPMEAGLAGGSADAAAVLRYFQKQYELPCTLEELASLGKQIGADVPFCVLNKLALVQGIGERLTPCAADCSFSVLLIKPKEGISTKEAFHKLDFSACAHPDTANALHAFMCNDRNAFYRYAGNTLEYSAFQMMPKLAEIKKELYAYGFPFVLMSGSGSTIFALCEKDEIVVKAANHFKDRYPFVCATKTM
ncbi:MAG: 4-(cytidine 5'-diphospho)-2-C-methyl-D-erythritol kinase [Erysipelotrichaceae bacterium]|nr:4-(cytidine 5'-diphospho)-2-C-methyl-D-erythritol kinase [Erysipelotrichaceae bacterium]